LIYLIFINNANAGFSLVPYASSDPEEVVYPIAETDLITLAGSDWEDKLDHLHLVDGQLIFN